MKGNAEVLDYLNFLLAGELAARDQYFIHSRMYYEWGYGKLFERINHEMEDETGHASALIKRILFLEGLPSMKPEALNIGTDILTMLQNDLAVELKVRDDIKKGIALCEKHQDYVSRAMLVEQLKDTEEDHADWLQKQLFVISQIGMQNYLQTQAA